MANANMAFGIKPINENGSDWSGQGRLICFLASYASNVFIGDPLVPTGASDAFGVPIMNIATAGATNAIAGAFLGVTNGPASGGNAATTLLQSNTVYRQASVLTYGLVSDDPNFTFAVQEDSSGGAIAIAHDAYTNGNLVAGAGSTATGLSGWQLQSSSVTGGAVATGQVKLLGLLRAPDNAIGTNAKWIVRLNLPSLWNASGV